MIELKKCQLVIESNVSKKNKVYYALYLVTESDDKIFLTFVNKSIFDNLSKI